MSDKTKDEYDEKAARAMFPSRHLMREGLTSAQELMLQEDFAKALRESAAEAFEEAAKEAWEPQMVLLTRADIADGMLDDKHPVIVARRVMRESIAKRLTARAAAIRRGE